MPLSFEPLSLGPPNNKHKEKDDREAVKDNVVVVDEGEGMKQIGKNVLGMPHLLGGMGCGMTMFTSRKSEPRQPHALETKGETKEGPLKATSYETEGRECKKHATD